MLVPAIQLFLGAGQRATEANHALMPDELIGTHQPIHEEFAADEHPRSEEDRCLGFGDAAAPDFLCGVTDR